MSRDPTHLSFARLSYRVSISGNGTSRSANKMRILNHSATAGGQPCFPSKGAGTPEANQHYPVSLPLHGAHYKKQLQPSSSLKTSTPAITISDNASQGGLLCKTSDARFISKKEGINEFSQLLTTNDCTKPMELDTFFMGPLVHLFKDKFNSMIMKEPVDVAATPNVVLAISVASAVELDGNQVDLIARKMKRLTGFTNLRMENTIDPSLIAGFVISYGDESSQVIDLSVKGQLANLAARVESFDKSISGHDQC